MIIDDVNRGIQKHKRRKRIGRGMGSGHGKTCGRGHKGYGSRAGASYRRGHEGGQSPLFLRVAKVGFNNKRFARTIAIVNVSALERAFEDGATVDREALAKTGLAKGRFDVIKVLGNGELTKKLTVHAHRFSKTAEEKITASGGKVERIA